MSENLLDCMIDIASVQAWLRKNAYDGLHNRRGCACGVFQIMPCDLAMDLVLMFCYPGILGKGPDGAPAIVDAVDPLYEDGECI